MKSEQTFTPRGLTSNWNFIQENSSNNKVKKGGDFVSRRAIAMRRELLNISTPKEKKNIDSDKFDVKVIDEEIVIQRINNKFSKKQVYSKSLAKKLGIM